MLTQNRLLIHLTGRLSSLRLDYDALIPLSVSTLRNRHEPLRFQTLVSCIPEVHLRHSLELIVKELEATHPDISNRVLFNPLPTPLRTAHYTLHTTEDGNLHVSTHDKQLYMEIDQFLLVDGLPTLFEIKISRSYRRRAPVHKKHIAKSANELMKYARINHLAQPLEEHYGHRRFGYVIVIPHNQVRSTSTNQQTFKELGGIIVPFFPDPFTYKREVCSSRLAQTFLSTF